MLPGRIDSFSGGVVAVDDRLPRRNYWALGSDDISKRMGVVSLHWLRPLIFGDFVSFSRGGVTIDHCTPRWGCVDVDRSCLRLQNCRSVASGRIGGRVRLFFRLIHLSSRFTIFAVFVILAIFTIFTIFASSDSVVGVSPSVARAAPSFVVGCLFTSPLSPYPELPQCRKHTGDTGNEGNHLACRFFDR